jgi:folylpolyglutamate synthase
LLSFVVFSQERTQVCVYEVLVGGKRDATNVVTKPIATGITKLGLDHTRTLGQGPYSTIHENIAWHKAGIFKSACPAFTIEQDAKFSGVVQSCAQETSTTLTIVKGDHFPQLHSVGRLKTEEQKQNASLAIMLAYSFLYPETSVLELTNTTRRGLEDCRLLGRSQTIVSGSCKWCLDVAHNPMSIQAAGRWFCNEVCTGQQSSGRAALSILIFNQQSRDGSALLIELHNVLENIQIDYAIFCTDDVWADGTTIQGTRPGFYLQLCG